ncbi:MAG: flagellar motor switch protein FliG [Gammaproteobacteria bacterium]|nr:flagellar motor switch protein FliG [Gammaproteobacteria bacterium]
MSEAAESLSGIDKAAILLMAVGPETASKVVSNLSPAEVERLGIRMSNMGGITRELVEGSLRKFVEEIREQTSLGVRSEDYLKAMLVAALGDERAKMLIDRITINGRTKGLDALKWMEPRAMADLIRSEHPQIIALILSFISDQQAGKVLSMLPPELRSDIVMRIAMLDDVPPQAVRELDRVLEMHTASRASEQQSNLAGEGEERGGVSSAAAIMNALPPEVCEDVLEQIRKEDERLSSTIKEKMFIFEDLINVDDRGIQSLLREVTTEDLVMALKGASDMMNQKILKNMSQRAAELLRDDMDAKGPVRLSEVEDAQRRICDSAQQMADEGRLMLGSGDDFV